MDNLRVAELFYTSRLAFQRVDASDTTRLLLPGNSGDELELLPATSSTKLRLGFAVAHLAKVAEYLCAGGIPSHTNEDSIAITDPDGVVIFSFWKKTTFRARLRLSPTDENGNIETGRRRKKPETNTMYRMTVNSRMLAVFLAGVTAVIPVCVGQQKKFSNWPAGTSPKEIGKRVAQRFVASPHANVGKNTMPAFITYPGSVAWYGALTFAQLSSDKDLTSPLIRRFDRLLAQESALAPLPDLVDKTVFAAVPLEIYIETQQQKYLDLARQLADKQWEEPTPEGLTQQTRFWIDDMYMITLVQVQAYRATGESKYIDRAALEMAAYLDKLQQPNGLFYHALDAPFFWGRGNGWVAAEMAELLRSLPANHPLRPRIMESYRKMMASLLKFQGKDGTWRQLLD